MNALCYKIVFSKRLGSLVAVGEHTSGQGKAAGTGVRAGVFPEGAGTAGHGASGNFVGLLKSVFASVAISCVTTGMATAAGPAVNTLPTGYSVNSGNVAVSTSGADMTIKQTTDKASVNWQSFSIGSAASVNIQQNSASSVLLNRVVGNDPSQIFGKLTANGQVILINPNGIVFGKGGSVTASAFTASTFGMTDADFLAGKHKFSRNGSRASVTVEDGASINTTTPGGYIALIASTVNNQGNISAKQGSVALAAAETVTLNSAPTDNVGIPLSSKVRLELAPSTINASVENGGTITTEGGQVLMQAAAVADAVASVTHTGIIDTTGQQGGRVDILADHGHVRVSGTVKANSNNDTAGGTIMIGRRDETKTVDGKEVTQTILSAVTDASGATLESKGGFIETSGSFLKVDDISVKAKDWLLDPTDITISLGTDTATNTSGTFSGSGATSIINRNTLQNALVNTNVTITTASSGTGNGDITVADSVTWTSGKSLTLNADRNIVLNAALSGKDMTFNAQSVSGSLNGTINTHGGVLTLNTTNASATGSILGNISGSGSLVKTGVGKVTLNGAKSYSGGTTVSVGTLVGSHGGGDGALFSGFGSGAINIAGPATAYADNSSGTGWNVFSNTVTGTGTFQIKGSTVNRTVVGGDFSGLTGTIELVGNKVELTGGSNLVSGKVDTTATVNVRTGATLNIWDSHGTPVIGALTGDGKVAGVQYGANVFGNGYLTIGKGGTSLSTGEFSGVISNQGTINITKIGAGTQILTGNNTSTGTTTVSAGKLQIGKGEGTGNLGTGAVTIASGATLEFNRSDAYEASNAIGGAGNVIQSGAGTTTLNGTTTYTGTTTVKTGTLKFKKGSLSSSYDIVAGAIAEFNVASGQSWDLPASTIRGAGTLKKTGAGEVKWGGGSAKFNMSGGWIDVQEGTFVGGNSDNEDWTDNKSSLNVKTGAFFKGVEADVRVDALTGDGRVEIGYNGYGGSITTGVNNHATGTAEFSGVIKDIDGQNVGGFVKEGTGTQILSGDNTYSGTTTVNGGTLQIGNGGNSGTLGGGAVTLANDANLVYKRSSETSIATNAISGQGNVSADITGTGKLIINEKIELTGSTEKNKVDLRANGDIDLKNIISTSSEALDAVKLVAGRDAVFQTDGSWSKPDGNVTVTGQGSITVGDGGVAAIYSGSINGTSGLGSAGPSDNTNMANVGSGKFRYNSDEVTSNFTTGLVGKGSDNTNGVNVIYREAPTVTIAVNNVTKTYDGNSYTGGTFNNMLPLGSSLQNGDTVGMANANATFSGSAQGVKGVLASFGKKITASDQGGKNALGYKVTYTEGELKINPLSLTAVYVANNKVFDGNTSAFVTATLKDIIGTDKVSLSHTGANFNSADVGPDKTVTVTGIRLVGDDASNYTLPLATINAINKASITARPPTPPTPVVPTNNAGARVKVPVGSANPFALASAEDLTDDTCSANSVENCYCEESAVSQGVDICYEPKTAAKGSVR